MTTDQAAEIPRKKSFRRIIQYCREVITIFRDGSLLIVFLLLVLWPEKINDILVRAGFEEGSVAGFTWKSKLDDSNLALQRAEATIENLKKQLQEQKRALEEVSASASTADQLDYYRKLAQESEDVNLEAQETKAVVSQAIDSNTPLLSEDKPQRLANKDLTPYNVGLQTLGVSNQERVKLNKQLIEKGYRLDEITYSYPKGERPSWFARTSTVFYYASQSRTAAQQLSKTLETLTGQAFNVQLGAGLGVDPNEKKITLFIHYIED